MQGTKTAGIGVRTGAGSFCCWYADTDGIRLCIDTRCGGSGVKPGSRTIHAAELICARSMEGETPFGFSRRFAGMLCDHPVGVSAPVYGANNWYYAYGKSSAENILRDSCTISELSSDARPANDCDEWISPACAVEVRYCCQRCDLHHLPDGDPPALDPRCKAGDIKK